MKRIRKEYFTDCGNYVSGEHEPDNRGLQYAGKSTTKAYSEMLKLYDESLTRSIRGQSPDPLLKEVRNYISDYPRTILMMRAIRRAIEEVLKNQEGTITVTEAGCGTGFLAVFAATISKRINVLAIDRSQCNIRATNYFTQALGLTGQVETMERDILEDDNIIDTNVLIAEHLSRGLLDEPATAIPRHFNVEPRYSIPFATRPVIFFGAKKEKKRVEGQTVNVFVWNGKMQIINGEKIILADPNSTDNVLISGLSGEIEPGENDIIVGNDIEWCHPDLGRENGRLLQTNASYARETYSVGGWQNHLLGPTDLFFISDNEAKRNLTINNNSDKIRSGVPFTVSYKVGFRSYSKQKPPYLYTKL